jgi:hypothetical protein
MPLKPPHGDELQHVGLSPAAAEGTSGDAITIDKESLQWAMDALHLITEPAVWGNCSNAGINWFIGVLQQPCWANAVLYARIQNNRHASAISPLFVYLAFNFNPLLNDSKTTLWYICQ